MRIADINIVESYYTLLRNLSPNNKLELIARLSKSLKTPPKAKDNTWRSLFGALVIDNSVDEFVAELKNDRQFGRKEIDL